MPKSFHPKHLSPSPSMYASQDMLLVPGYTSLVDHDTDEIECHYQDDEICPMPCAQNSALLWDGLGMFLLLVNGLVMLLVLLFLLGLSLVLVGYKLYRDELLLLGFSVEQPQLELKVFGLPLWIYVELN